PEDPYLSAFAKSHAVRLRKRSIRPLVRSGKKRHTAVRCSDSPAESASLHETARRSRFASAAFEALIITPHPLPNRERMQNAHGWRFQESAPFRVVEEA